MFQGKISKALRHIDTESNISGVHETNDTILESLKYKHPPAKPVNEDCVLKSLDAKVEPVIIEEIDSNLI